MAIASVRQDGSTVHIYNEQGAHIGSLCIVSGAQFMGYTGSTVSVKDGSTMKIYNEKGNFISSHPA